MTFFRTSASCTPSNFGTPMRFDAAAAVVVKSTPSNSARQPIETRGGIVVTRQQDSIRKEGFTSALRRQWGRPGLVGAGTDGARLCDGRSARGVRSALAVRAGAGDRRGAAPGRCISARRAASEQSAIEPGNPRAVPVEYVRYALLGLAHHGRPRRVLMVGLGGGTFTTLVHRALPDTTVDAVEIDPVVVAAARAHFGLREDARYRVHVADAADWMARDRGSYDFVLLDAYAGEGIPAALASEAFFRASRGGWRPGGVVAINIAEMQADRAGGRARLHARADAVRLPADARRRQRAAVRRRRPARRRPGRHAAAGSPTGMRAARPISRWRRWRPACARRGVRACGLARRRADVGGRTTRCATGSGAVVTAVAHSWMHCRSPASSGPGSWGMTVPHGRRVDELVEQEAGRGVDPPPAGMASCCRRTADSRSGSPAARAGAR